MSPEVIIEIMNQAMLVIIKISLPLLLTSLIVGIAVSIIQALTQIQEATLSFVPKMIALFIVITLAMPFIGATLGGFSLDVYNRIIHP